MEDEIATTQVLNAQVATRMEHTRSNTWNTRGHWIKWFQAHMGWRPVADQQENISWEIPWIRLKLNSPKYSGICILHGHHQFGPKLLQMRNPKIYSELNKRMVYSKQGDVFASVVTGHNSRNVTVLEGNWFNNDAPAQRVSHRFSSQMWIQKSPSRYSSPAGTRMVFLMPNKTLSELFF